MRRGYDDLVRHHEGDKQFEEVGITLEHPPVDGYLMRRGRRVFAYTSHGTSFDFWGPVLRVMLIKEMLDRTEVQIDYNVNVALYHFFDVQGHRIFLELLVREGLVDAQPPKTKTEEKG